MKKRLFLKVVGHVTDELGHIGIILANNIDVDIVWDGNVHNVFTLVVLDDVYHLDGFMDIHMEEELFIEDCNLLYGFFKSDKDVLEYMRSEIDEYRIKNKMTFDTFSIDTPPYETRLIEEDILNGIYSGEIFNDEYKKIQWQFKPEDNRFTIVNDKMDIYLSRELKLDNLDLLYQFLTQYAIIWNDEMVGKIK